MHVLYVLLVMYDPDRMLSRLLSSIRRSSSCDMRTKTCDIASLDVLPTTGCSTLACS